MATLKDIADEFYLDEDWIIDFSVSDETGNAADITGATIEFRIQKSAVSKKYGIGTGIAILDAVGGTGTLTISPTDQTDYVKGIWNYELWVKLADNTSSIQAKGTLTIGASLKHSYP